MAFCRFKSCVSAAAVSLLLAVLVPSVVGSVGHNAGADPMPWKGAESLNVVSLAPNPDHCGAAPSNLFAVLSGSGVDVKAGVFEVQLTGCINLDTLRVFNLEATDTFLASGDSITVIPGDATLRLDEISCIATNTHPVPFTVVGGTGTYENATGKGTYDLAMNHPQCNGLAHPAYVWFKGDLKLARG